jgi:hypothetical protein
MRLKDGYRFSLDRPVTFEPDVASVPSARYLDMPGKSKRMHSIKNKKTYEALKRKGMPKSRAARISNAQKKKSK